MIDVPPGATAGLIAAVKRGLAMISSWIERKYFPIHRAAEWVQVAQPTIFFGNKEWPSVSLEMTVHLVGGTDFTIETERLRLSLNNAVVEIPIRATGVLVIGKSTSWRALALLPDKHWEFLKSKQQASWPIELVGTVMMPKQGLAPFRKSIDFTPINVVG